MHTHEKIQFSRQCRIALFVSTIAFLAGCNHMTPNNLTTKSTDNQPNQVSVIVLHGLGRSHRSMNTISKALSREGYAVYNLSYPSRKLPVEQLVDLHLAPRIAQLHTQNTKVYLVTHSMGGILARAYLEKYPNDPVDRIVMLAPPNQGSEIIDALGQYSFFRTLFGPAALQLSTSTNALVRKLSVPSVPTGIIAGTKSYNPITSLMIPGEDDGKVSVKSTLCNGVVPQKDTFIKVPCAHTFIMNDAYVIEQTLAFLRQGSFSL